MLLIAHYVWLTFVYDHCSLHMCSSCFYIDQCFLCVAHDCYALFVIAMHCLLLAYVHMVLTAYCVLFIFVCCLLLIMCCSCFVRCSSFSMCCLCLLSACSFLYVAYVFSIFFAAYRSRVLCVAHCLSMFNYVFYVCILLTAHHVLLMFAIHMLFTAHYVLLMFVNCSLLIMYGACWCIVQGSLCVARDCTHVC